MHYFKKKDTSPEEEISSVSSEITVSTLDKTNKDNLTNDTLVSSQQAEEKKNLFTRIKNELNYIWYMTQFKAVLFFIICCMCIYFIGFPIYLKGPCMLPTIEDGQVAFCDRFLNTYHRNDIIIIREGKMFIGKRIIGLPGETIQIKEGKVYINGERYKEDISEDIDIMYPGLFASPITLSDDEYFVLGDNRNNSTDSRVFGPIEYNKIRGKIITKIHTKDTKDISNTSY